MARRIAVVDNKKLRDMQQKQHLINICPINKGGAECIYLEGEKLGIAENLCIGCGICVKVAPEAISIINLPEQLDSDPIHRYGRNGFHLYSLPTPVFGKVTGILGKNGIGKSTALQILSGQLQPNVGTDTAADYKQIISYFKGTQAQGYFEKVRDGKITMAIKPQLVDVIPDYFSGTVIEFLVSIKDDKQRIDLACQALSLMHLLDRPLKALSGGELQRVAIAGASLKQANVLFVDEPTSYLDVKQRVHTSQYVRSLATNQTAVLVVEHDLIILDAMTDLIHLMYGKENVYGVVSLPEATKSGINTYLDGYLRADNIRFRDYTIDFHRVVEKHTAVYPALVSWGDMECKVGDFQFRAESGVLRRHEVVGVLGENGIGKTTFVKILAGLLTPDSGGVNEKISVSYKPQYLKANSDVVVRELLQDALEKYSVQLIKPLELMGVLDQSITELSGGQLQRVAIAAALSREADLYLLDEPSAYLDVEQRLVVSKVIMDFMLLSGKTALVVDHDLLFLDYLSTRLMVFDGTPGISGVCKGPYGLQEGMNHFLADLGLTFRRDEQSHRPRANKVGSQMDELQKKQGTLYYV